MNETREFNLESPMNESYDAMTNMTHIMAISACLILVNICLCIGYHRSSWISPNSTRRTSTRRTSTSTWSTSTGPLRTDSTISTYFA